MNHLDRNDFDFYCIDYPRHGSNFPKEDPMTILIYWRLTEDSSDIFGMQIKFYDTGIYIMFDGNNIKPIKKVKFYDTGKYIIKIADILDDLKEAINEHMDIYNMNYEDYIAQLNRPFLNFKLGSD